MRATAEAPHPSDSAENVHHGRGVNFQAGIGIGTEKISELRSTIEQSKNLSGVSSSPHPLRGYVFIAAATLLWGISAALAGLHSWESCSRRVVRCGRLIR